MTPNEKNYEEIMLKVKSCLDVNIFEQLEGAVEILMRDAENDGYHRGFDDGHHEGYDLAFDDYA